MSGTGQANMFDTDILTAPKLIGGRHFLIKLTGGPTLKFLPRAVQPLKLLPRRDTTSHF